MLQKILSVTRKEFLTFFTSPIAYIFLGTFLLATYFSFFWVETFFARNISDLRPLFEWMPLLLIFLVAAITMRMWSEERRLGTLEFLLTVPVKTHHLVIGKFLACLILVGLALLLTLSLPITVASLGDLDWGPVLGAYLASLFLAAAYIAIGLYVSSKSDNQIVSLILTIVIGLAFYFIGSSSIANLFGNFGDFLKQLSTSARFESISRGIIDFRDIYYYLTIVGVFLTANVFSLEHLKWSETKKPAHKTFAFIMLLLIFNLIAANFWLQKTRFLRTDLTEGKVHTLSQATKDVVGQLQEPLLIRGYFSSKTHPLLSPLIPQISDLLYEYRNVGRGRIRAEVLDPKNDEELEEEAGRKYSIRPTPLQMQDKYQASLVNAYFDVVIEYGDKHEVLGFRDLIEVNPAQDGTLDVRLKNLEYDITRSIKKVMYGFKSVENLFDSLARPVQLKAFISAKELLPEKLANFSTELSQVLEEYKASSNGKFQYEVLEPEANGGALATELTTKYGFQPMIASLFDANPFYFYMLLESGEKLIQVSLPENLSKEGAKKGLESALKRVAPGFLKTVGLYVPPAAAPNPFMRQLQGGKQFNFIEQHLKQNLTVKRVDLDAGSVAEDIDLLVVVAPKALEQKDIFTIDQFLMRGGTVILSTSPFSSKTMGGALSLEKSATGLKTWLAHNGVEFEDKLVLDKQNEALAVPIKRNLGGFVVEEMKMLNYPPFVDIRRAGMNEENTILSGLTQVTLNWPSPLVVNAEKNKNRKITELLHSSKDSWTTDKLVASPDFNLYPKLGFPIDDTQQEHLLAAIVEGGFTSYFAGKDLAFLKPEEPEAKEGEEKQEPEEIISAFIDKSPDSARLIVFASQEFLADQTLQMSATSGTNRYQNTVQLLDNAIDWSLEDPALLGIRTSGQFARTLVPLNDTGRVFWEYANYVVALGLLLLLWIIFRMYRGTKTRLQVARYLEAQ